jgi:voltage-gated potassium channel
VGAALAIGTAGYMLLEGWNLSDALYMTVISVTTAGFREVRTLDAIGRVWTMLVTGFGVVLIFGSVGLVTEATSGRRVGRHMTRQVDELRGHFVVCGYGRVGSTVAHELVHDGESFVVIDVNRESLARARDDGYLVVEGDATDDATLRAGGITRAKGPRRHDRF